MLPGGCGRLRLAVQIARWEPQPGEFDFLLGLLPEEEAADCRKFRFHDDQKRALVSRLLQRHAAATALGIAHAAVVIKRTRGRKPYIANEVIKPQAPNFNYSVSHEGDYVILASEAMCMCGCDLAAPQQLRRGKAQPLADVLASFTKQLTSAEWATVHAAGADDDAVESQFRKLWSLKEAYVKATGEGLGFDLGSAEFVVSGSTAAVRVHGTPQPRWAFHLHQLGRGHWVSVARAPLDAVVDAWGGFRATFQRAALSDEELAAAVAAPEPPFAMLAVSDLVPPGQRQAYVDAGGDVL